ncbi:MAG: HD-GYP domain-containing protein, partial [Firmicutes bacterium]|nr:HD-GYP domain-containing protein [Bacillota bacterium]
FPLEEVLEYLMGASGREFDPHSVRKFINCISFYPVGAEVELNTGERGVVVKSNKGLPTRPIVRVEKNIYGQAVPRGYLVNLAEQTTYFVKRRLDSDMG